LLLLLFFAAWQDLAEGSGAAKRMVAIVLDNAADGDGV